MKTLFTFIITLVLFNLSSQTLIPITAALNNSNAENLTVFDGKLFFSAKTGTITNIYSINGNAAPVKVNSTDYPTPEEFTVVNNKLIFSAGTTDRKAYYINAGSTTINPITGNYSNPTDFVSNGTNFYFQGKSLTTPANQGIFQWNGSSTSPSTKISDKVGRSWNQNEYRNSRFGHEKHLMVVGNKLFFHQSNGVYYTKLDGSLNNTLIPNSASYFYEMNDYLDNAGDLVGSKIVYSANTISSGFTDGLVIIDASLTTPSAIYLPVNSTNSAPDHFTSFNGLMFFLAYNSLFKYVLHVYNPVTNQISSPTANNDELTVATNSADDPILIVNNKLYYGNKEVTISNNVASINTTSACFEIGYSGKEGVIFFNNKFYWDSGESGSFELYSCNPKKKETCLNGPDNPIYKKIVYNNKIYFVDPFGYPTHILRFPEDQGNGLCQPVVNNEKFTGNAYHDKNCNGVKDVGDIALSGVTFTIEGTNNTQVSGTNGDFTFSNLASGSLTVAATLPSGYEFKNPLNGKQTITLPNTLGVIQFGFCTKSIDTCRNVGVHLDGTNDYIELKSPYSGNQPITIEMWVQSQSSSTGVCSNNSSANLDWILAFDDNNLGIVDCDGDLRVVFRPLCPSGNALCSSLPVRPIDDNKWHHIAITLSPTTGFRVYFDGVRFANFGHSPYNLDGTIRLGRSFGTGSTAGNHYKGKMDEVRLWDIVKTDAEILESYKCKLAGNEANLLVYYDFEEGVAGGNNTVRTFIDNVVSISNAYDGSIKNLTLNDTLSNYICVHHDHLPCGGENTCTPACSTTSVNIGTGVDYIDGSLSPINSYDGSWRLISGPDPVNYPRPVYVLNPISAWASLPNSQYISPYPNPYFNGVSSIPYVIERCFCVCKDNSNIVITVNSHVDNFLDLTLHKEDGALLNTLLDYNGVGGNSEASAFQGDPFVSSLTTTLNQGKYCLRAGLRNDGSTAMGVSISAILTGAGLIENGCCDTFTYITGYVYNDKACNSLIDYPQDIGISNAVVKLCNASGGLVASTTTDGYGYYTFSDIPPGIYTVKQDSIPGRTRLQGSDGYTINLNQNTAIGNLDFGNCTNCCATSEKLTAAVNKGVRSVDIVDTLNQKVTLRLPKLLSCQYVSKIYWGDGNVSTLNQGDPMPIHTYQIDGTYLISIEVTSKNLDRICQIDEVNFTILFDCIASSTIDPDQSYLTIYPNPATEKLNVLLGQNINGYFVKIFDINGKNVLSTNFDKSFLIHAIDISILKPGVYIMNLDDNQGSKLIAKFVKL